LKDTSSLNESLPLACLLFLDLSMLSLAASNIPTLGTTTQHCFTRQVYSFLSEAVMPIR